MRIYAIDDEQAMLEELHKAIALAEPGAEILDFKTASGVLAALKEPGNRPDVVFTDIRLPGMDGLSLAVHIKNAAPKAKIVFVTGYAQYTLEAYQRHVNGYVMKPVMPERIREELDAMDLPAAAPIPEDKLRVRCFGQFEVFWQGEPLIFRRRQSKELLAFLINQEGRACTSEDIISALWEEGGTVKNPQPYLRQLGKDLSDTLAAIGMERVLIREHRQWAIRKELLDCDYYRMLDGDNDAVNAYRGEYMSQYSWAELTAGALYFRYQSKP
jgi:two-component SAPR family response regulator